MLRLTREVRFALDPHGPGRGGHGGFAGNPSAEGLAPFVVVRVTVRGEPDPVSQYLLNIKDIDHAVRSHVVPLCRQALGHPPELAGLPAAIFAALSPMWPGVALDAVELLPNPWLGLLVHHTETHMLTIQQRFEFCAAHRLHNPALTDTENLKLFGKCSNPHGHGHNYQLAVDLRVATPAAGAALNSGRLADIVQQHVLEAFDHKNLNAEVPEFAHVIPTVENIARVIFARLESPLAELGRLESVRVWESDRTSAQYTRESPV
jgi:6-pyruvoyltetrahydropterin/6-carboxytetrahydropterin synthase